MTNELVMLVAILQAAQTTVKILHWRTRSFSQHVALDECKEALAKYADIIAETALGLEPGCLDSLQSVTTDLSETDAVLFIKQLTDIIQPLVEAVGDESDALETTLDDMMQALFVVKYKLEQLQ